MLGPAVLDGEGGLTFKITESSLLQQILGWRLDLGHADCA
jgi:hypothetical protein